MSRTQASPWDLRIDEIHYHPLGGSGNADLEFIELYNAGSAAVDLGGWFFAAGIEYTFPPGTVIDGREYLVLSPNPRRAAAHYGLARVEGPYDGRLDNGGEIVALSSAAGERISEVHYRDGGPWPGTPDGLGPSLEFTEVDHREDLHIRWKRSLFVGGTPGVRNSRAEVLPTSSSSRRELLSEGALWRTFRGVENPSASLLDWTRDDFDDATWEELPGGFGYGSGQGFRVSTQLTGMRNRFTTFYIRREFALEEATATALAAGDVSLELLVSFDDGYIAYLNGIEVARNNAGAAGVPAAYDALADANASGTDRIAIDAGLLGPEGNVLAIQGLNRTLNSGDFFIGASLAVDASAMQSSDRAAGDPLTRGVLNEVGAQGDDDSPGFVELYNPEATVLDLGGFLIQTDRGETHRIPAGTVLEPGAFVLLDATVLSFSVPAAGRTFLLLGEDGRTLIDALEVDPAGVAGSFGRYPDGGDDTAVFVAPTPGIPNAFDTTPPVVINEIYFHPPFVPAGGACPERCSDELQFIELWNRADQTVDLTGWSLSGAVRFAFSGGTIIRAGEALVIAANLEEFRREHPDVTNVVGDWSGRLQHDSETVDLRDDLGNRRDRVSYGDGGPWNDEQPADGRDDRTFAASWPTGADGEGSSLELVHPMLENGLGASWRASTTPGGTPGSVNSTFAPDVAPVVGSLRHRPAVPRSDQMVTISCHPHGITPIARVTLEWLVDGSGGAPSLLAMNDAGEAGDEVARDGIHSIQIPPQEDGSLIRWRFLVEDIEGRSSVSPRSPPVAPYRGFEGPFYLCEVDDTPPPANAAAVYRILMTAADVDELGERGVESDVLLPATFIADGEVHYLAGVRYRGETSRREPNRSYRIDFPPEDRFDGVEHLNLNGGNGGGQLGDSTVAEILAADLFRRAGVPSPQTWAVNLHFPGEVGRDFDPRYARKENIDGEFLARSFGDGSDDRNLYRARNPGGPGRPSGDLSYLGNDPEEYRALYEKKSNREEDDFRDVILLARAFDPVATPPERFADTLEGLIDADQWARFFAVMALLTNADGGIWNNNGEDYFLYRVNDDSPREDAGKWLLLPWDLEETFAASGERLFLPDVESIQRFLSEPRFARLYYRHLDAVRQGPFSRGEMIKRLDIASRMFPAQDVFEVVDPLDAFVAARLGFLDRSVARSVTAGPGVPARQTVRLVDFGETWSFVRGRTDPPGEPMAWTRRDYDSAGWESGRMGFGYDDGDDQTVLDDMEDQYTTVFVRRSFSLDDPAVVDRCILTMDYDDAFIAYVNGVEVARSANAPGERGDPVTFDQTAAQTHEAGTVERFAFSPGGLGLTPGGNVLAIAGFNQAL
ncbi:MAG: lamin tail domain-containing protein, partial [Actinobacteria bacterium]|nr:lamin tail domain-containing protein [Actinomycetota bacterium]